MTNSNETSPTSRPFVIGIGGGSGSGKTYLANRISEVATGEQVSVLSMDSYFRSLQPGDGVPDPRDVNFDHPAHIDLNLFLQDLDSLRRGEKVRRPSYDFRTQIQTPASVEVEPRKVIVVEGLFVLASPIADRLDLSLFLEVAPDQRLIGRILRDVKERGADIYWTIDRYQRFVRPSYDEFVEPTKHNADVVVDFTFRRALFVELLTHVVADFVSDSFDARSFVQRVREDTFRQGAIGTRSRRPVDLNTLIERSTVRPIGEPGEEPVLQACDNSNC